MKYLVSPELQNLATLLYAGIDLGDFVVHGRVEAYSCKKAGDDKRLAKEIESALMTELATSPLSPGTSPLGPLESSSTRKLLVSLITTLNASFQDYDFTSLRPDQFVREMNHHVVENSINTQMMDAIESAYPGTTSQFWQALDSLMDLEKCEIYSLVPDMDSDVFNVGKLWSFNYFFFNKKLKKIVFFTADATSALRNASFDAAAAGQTSDMMEDDLMMEDDDYEDMPRENWEETYGTPASYLWSTNHPTTGNSAYGSRIM